MKINALVDWAIRSPISQGTRHRRYVRAVMLAVSFILIGLVSSSHRLHNNGFKTKFICHFRLASIEKQRRNLEESNKDLEESEFEHGPPLRITEEILKNPLIASAIEVEVTCVSGPGDSYRVYSNRKPFWLSVRFEDSNGKPVEFPHSGGISSIARIWFEGESHGRIEFGRLGLNLDALKGYLMGKQNFMNFASPVIYRVTDFGEEYGLGHCVRLKPGDIVKFKDHLWTNITFHDMPITPGVYRARAVCSFIREGEMDEHEIESEPITFEITEQHIKDYLATWDEPAQR